MFVVVFSLSRNHSGIRPEVGYLVDTRIVDEGRFACFMYIEYILTKKCGRDFFL